MKTKAFYPHGLRKLGAEFLRRSPLLLVLDFDGTLAPIAPTPEAAKMPPAVRGALKRILRRRDARVAVLSGRALPDASRKVSLPGVVIAGSHGMDSSDRRLCWSGRKVRAWKRAAREAARRLKPLLKGWKGARLELKGPDLSLHFRLARPSVTVRRLPEAVHLVRGLPLSPRGGKCVLEFRPSRAPGKGEALARLARFLAPGWRKTGLCVYIGDDVTDEDAFRMLRKLGRHVLGLRVGPGPSRAHFHLRDEREILRFLASFRTG